MAIDTKLGQRFAANPVHTPAQHGRLSLDPRLAGEFMQSSSISPETKAQLSQYIGMAKWSAPERAIYSSVIDGFTSQEELQTVTGMTAAKVKTTIGKLERRGVLRKVSSDEA